MAFDGQCAALYTAVDIDKVYTERTERTAYLDAGLVDRNAPLLSQSAGC